MLSRPRECSLEEAFFIGKLRHAPAIRTIDSVSRGGVGVSICEGVTRGGVGVCVVVPWMGPHSPHTRAGEPRRGSATKDTEWGGLAENAAARVLRAKARRPLERRQKGMNRNRRGKRKRCSRGGASRFSCAPAGAGAAAATTTREAASAAAGRQAAV